MLKIDNEFSALIPRLTEEEFIQLEKNILDEGCRDPLVLWNDVLIDGHNRYTICQKHNIEFKTTQLEFENRELVYNWIIENQLGRRNLTEEQKSYLRGKRYNREKRQGKRTDLTCPQNEDKLKTAECLGNEYKVSRATIERDGDYTKAIDTIADNCGEETKQKILAREIPITKKDVENISEMPKEKQKKIFDKVKTGEAQSIRDAKRIITKEERKDAPELKGKYRIIYADPPWNYGNELIENYGDVKKHYPTMTIEELCELPIKDLTEDNAVLFLWVTSPLLEECFTVIKAWGFKYKTSFVWDKIKHNFGHYNSVRHELLLICTKGSCTPDNKELHDSVISIEKSNKHSEKPEYFRELIDKMYFKGKRIELFARTKAKNWEVWGNE